MYILVYSSAETFSAESIVNHRKEYTPPNDAVGLLKLIFALVKKEELRVIPVTEEDFSAFRKDLLTAYKLFDVETDYLDFLDFFVTTLFSWQTAKNESSSLLRQSFDPLTILVHPILQRYLFPLYRRASILTEILSSPSPLLLFKLRDSVLNEDTAKRKLSRRPSRFSFDIGQNWQRDARLLFEINAADCHSIYFQTNHLLNFLSHILFDAHESPDEGRGRLKSNQQPSHLAALREKFFASSTYSNRMTVPHLPQPLSTLSIQTLIQLTVAQENDTAVDQSQYVPNAAVFPYAYLRILKATDAINRQHNRLDAREIPRILNSTPEEHHAKQLELLWATFVEMEALGYYGVKRYWTSESEGIILDNDITLNSSPINLDNSDEDIALLLNHLEPASSERDKAKDYQYANIDTIFNVSDTRKSLLLHTTSQHVSFVKQQSNPHLSPRLQVSAQRCDNNALRFLISGSRDHLLKIGDIIPTALSRKLHRQPSNLFFKQFSTNSFRVPDLTELSPLSDLQSQFDGEIHVSPVLFDDYTLVYLLTFAKSHRSETSFIALKLLAACLLLTDPRPWFGTIQTTLVPFIVEILGITRTIDNPLAIATATVALVILKALAVWPQYSRYFVECTLYAHLTVFLSDWHEQLTVPVVNLLLVILVTLYNSQSFVHFHHLQFEIKNCNEEDVQNLITASHANTAAPILQFCNLLIVSSYPESFSALLPITSFILNCSTSSKDNEEIRTLSIELLSMISHETGENFFGLERRVKLSKVLIESINASQSSSLCSAIVDLLHNLSLYRLTTFSDTALIPNTTFFIHLVNVLFSKLRNPPVEPASFLSTIGFNQSLLAISFMQDQTPHIFILLKMILEYLVLYLSNNSAIDSFFVSAGSPQTGPDSDSKHFVIFPNLSTVLANDLHMVLVSFHSFALQHLTERLVPQVDHLKETFLLMERFGKYEVTAKTQIFQPYSTDRIGDISFIRINPLRTVGLSHASASENDNLKTSICNPPNETVLSMLIEPNSIFNRLFPLKLVPSPDITENESQLGLDEDAINMYVCPRREENKAISTCEVVHSLTTLILGMIFHSAPVPYPLNVTLLASLCHIIQTNHNHFLRQFALMLLALYCSSENHWSQIKRLIHDESAVPPPLATGKVIFTSEDEMHASQNCPSHKQHSPLFSMLLSILHSEFGACTFERLWIVRVLIGIELSFKAAQAKNQVEANFVMPIEWMEVLCSAEMSDDDNIRKETAKLKEICGEKIIEERKERRSRWVRGWADWIEEDHIVWLRNDQPLSNEQSSSEKEQDQQDSTQTKPSILIRFIPLKIQRIGNTQKVSGFYDVFRRWSEETKTQNSTTKRSSPPVQTNIDPHDIVLKITRVFLKEIGFPQSAPTETSALSNINQSKTTDHIQQTIHALTLSLFTKPEQTVNVSLQQSYLSTDNHIPSGAPQENVSASLDARRMAMRNRHLYPPDNDILEFFLNKPDVLVEFFGQWFEMIYLDEDLSRPFSQFILQTLVLTVHTSLDSDYHPFYNTLYNTFTTVSFEMVYHLAQNQATKAHVVLSFLFLNKGRDLDPSVSPMLTFLISKLDSQEAWQTLLIPAINITIQNANNIDMVAKCGWFSAIVTRLTTFFSPTAPRILSMINRFISAPSESSQMRRQILNKPAFVKRALNEMTENLNNITPQMLKNYSICVTFVYNIIHDSPTDLQVNGHLRLIRICTRLLYQDHTQLISTCEQILVRFIPKIIPSPLHDRSLISPLLYQLQAQIDRPRTIHTFQIVHSFIFLLMESIQRGHSQKESDSNAHYQLFSEVNGTTVLTKVLDFLETELCSSSAHVDSVALHQSILCTCIILSHATKQHHLTPTLVWRIFEWLCEALYRVEEKILPTAIASLWCLTRNTQNIGVILAEMPSLINSLDCNTPQTSNDHVVGWKGELVKRDISSHSFYVPCEACSKFKMISQNLTLPAERSNGEAEGSSDVFSINRRTFIHPSSYSCHLPMVIGAVFWPLASNINGKASLQLRQQCLDVLMTMYRCNPFLTGKIFNRIHFIEQLFDTLQECDDDYANSVLLLICVGLDGKDLW
ncbi:hypothetical protein BLNAU_2696 [Blattamonas nauphoetae]|uniref:Uncharacterized protein n=1 Tax=Blattamonas nauphoetae TaxID=2049346 RepID=A0ABQ9YFG9_9EUKA|nr:hypothetical protein BLNAU_2696 [Blattamonas nauphoetae]